MFQDLLVTTPLKIVRKMNIDFDVREGSVFEPWKKMKFDVIVSDVAAVAEKVSKIFPLV